MLDRIILFLISILTKGGDEMVWRDIYVKLIIAKRRTADKIKDQELRKLVLEDLRELGYDGYGNPITEEGQE